MSVSAVVVTYNSEKHISKCLTALADEIAAVGGEIILFDNNSTDATLRIVESTFPDVKISSSIKNIGFASACNKAANLAVGKYLLFANPDMVIDKGALGILLKAINSLPEAGAVTARMRFPDGRFQPTCRQFPNYRNIMFSRGSILKKGESSTGQYTLDDSEKTVEVPAASATCLLMDKDFFQKIGGFDKRFFMFMEDTDLCQSISQAGKKVYFVPDAGAEHYWGEGATASEIRRKWYHHISVWKYFLKHYPNGFSLFVLPLALLFNFLLTILTGRKKDR